MEERKFFECDCHGEGIIIDNDPENETIDMAMWSYGSLQVDGRLTWAQKLRWVWTILIKGRSHMDQVILNYSQARTLGLTLVKMSETRKVR